MHRFLTIFMWVILSSSYAFSQRTPLSEADELRRVSDQKIVSNLISKFHTTGNDKIMVAIKAAHFIREYRYEDTADIIMRLIYKEISGAEPGESKTAKGRRNKRVLEELLESLSEVVEKRHVFPGEVSATESSPLIELKMWAIRVLESEEKFTPISDWKKKFDEVIAAAKSRPNSETVKLFPGVAAPTLEHISKLNIDFTLAEAEEKKALEGNTTEDNSASKKTITVTPEDQEKAKNYVKFKDELMRIMPGGKSSRNGTMSEVKAGDSGPAELLLKGTTRFITDEITDDILSDNHIRVRYRDDVLKKLYRILARYQQSNAVLLGSAGSGKTSIVDLLAEQIILGNVSSNVVTRFLANAIIIETSVGTISRLAKSDKAAGQADAMEAYLTALREVQKKIGRRIILFFDEIHTLTPEQTEVLKKYTSSSKGEILLIGASTAPEYNSTFKHNKAILRRFETLAVWEFSEKEIYNIFRESWDPILTIRHNGITYSDEVVQLLTRQSSTIYPEKGNMNGTFILADDVALDLRMKANNDSISIDVTEKDVYDFLKEQLNLPVDPRNYEEMEGYRKKLVEDISKDVFGQERMINDVVSLWMSVLRNESKRGIKVGMLLGRSGTGKTETAEQLALKSLGSMERVFTVKVSDYADANDIKMGELLGVPGGVTFGKHTSGRLMDWLDDPSKGKYAGIIVFDEVDKGNLLFWQKFMEFLDTGIITGGDNKTRRVRKHIVLMTTNHGDKVIFPDDVVTWSEEQIEKRISEYGIEELRALYEQIIPDSIVNRIDMVSLAGLIPTRIAKEIANRLATKITDSYRDRSGVKIKIDEKVIEEFVRVNNPLRRGARPLVRSLEPALTGAIETALGSTPFIRGDEITITVGKNKKGTPALQSTLNGTVLYSYMPNSKETESSAVQEEARGPEVIVVSPPKVAFKIRTPVTLTCQSLF